MIHKTLTYKDLGVKLPEIYEQMGYGSASDPKIVSNVGDDVKEEVIGILKEIETFLKPELCFFIAKGELSHIEKANNTSPQRPLSDQSPTEKRLVSEDSSSDKYILRTNGRILNIGKIIFRQLRGSSLFAFFVCTAGKEFQSYQDRLKREGDMMKEFTANAIGSVLAEKTADYMEKELEFFLSNINSVKQTQTDNISEKHTFLHTNRFSPGYCGWHVREQQLLFSTFPIEEPCGVHLTDSSLMLPIKSVSGIIGIGENVKKLDYTCGLCDYAKCYKRRKKQ